MAPRDQNLLSNDAADDIFSGMGIDPAELNGDVGDDLGDEGDDTGEDVDDLGGPEPQGDQRPQLDDLRLTQTRDRPVIRQPPKRAGVQFDAKGNVVGTDGKVVAKAGSEARLYTAASKAQNQLQGVNAQLADTNGRLTKAVEIGQRLAGELDTLKAREASMKEFGFEPDEQIKALKLWSDLRKDPAKTLQGMLTRAAAAGININGGPAPGATDASAIAGMIQEALTKGLKPLSEQSEAAKRQQETERQQREEKENVDREVRTFFNMNRDAMPYLGVFEQLMKDPQHRGMSLGEMWARIQLSMTRNPNFGRSGTRPDRRDRQMPRGRGRLPAERETEAAPIDQEYGSILDSVLTEAGYR